VLSVCVVRFIVICVLIASLRKSLLVLFQSEKTKTKAPSTVGTTALLNAFSNDQLRILDQPPDLEDLILTHDGS
jgi:hypothetical protein